MQEPVAQLPITADEVTFAEASPLQRKLAWELNGVSWAPPMTVAQYIDRETALSESALSAEGRCRYFVLHRTSDPNDIVSSCEATEKTILIRDPIPEPAAAGDASATAPVRQETAFSIASVYTNPAYRAKGMASLMLRQLHSYMDARSACSALYSDIGRVYYARLGWAVYPSQQVSLCVDDGESLLALPKYVRFVARSEVPALCERDVASLTDKLSRLPDDGKTTHVAFAPTASQLDWHFTRDGFMAKALANREVEHRGAVLESGRSWILWDHDFREKKLKVLRLVAAPGLDRMDEMAALLLAAAAEAADWKLQKVLVWNPDDEVSAAAKAVGDLAEGRVRIVFDERLDGSVPSLRWKAEGKTLEETSWDDNEYYAWC